VAPLGGCEASRAYIFDGEVTALITILLNITYDKSFVPGDAYPLVESSRPLCVYSRLSYVRRQWDRFHTQVLTNRRSWAYTVMSLHARRLNPPLPEAQSR
jgi:hypothetical protein